MEMEVLQWTPIKKSQHQPIIRIIYADMEDIIQWFSNKKHVAFAHCISGDFGADRQMSAGVALAFREHFGRPTENDCLTTHLAFQQASVEGAGVYSLVTKPKYNGKPRKSDYDQAFNELIDELNKKGYKHLICSPMGCVRDHITIDHFLSNILYLEMQTGVSVSIVTCNEYSRGNLWNGLTYQDFVRKLWTGIEVEYLNLEQSTTQESILHQAPVIGTKMEVLQWAPRETPHNQTTIRIIYADMKDIIHQFRDNEHVAFAHCISADFGAGRQITAGVTLTFRKEFGRPTEHDRLSTHLAFQQTSDEGAGVYSLITKPKYYRKPRTTDYDQAFNELIKDLNRKGYKHLICSPMGCVRDRITIDHFIANILYVQLLTGISVSIVTCNEQSRGKLWNGLSYQDFLRQMWTVIKTEFQKY